MQDDNSLLCRANISKITTNGTKHTAEMRKAAKTKGRKEPVSVACMQIATGCLQEYLKEQNL